MARDVSILGACISPARVGVNQSIHLYEGNLAVLNFTKSTLNQCLGHDPIHTWAVVSNSVYSYSYLGK